jgi:hypothetical protein
MSDSKGGLDEKAQVGDLCGQRPLSKVYRQFAFEP